MSNSLAASTSGIDCRMVGQEFTALLFTPVSITALIGTEDARFILNGISPIAKGDLKWRDALLVTGTVNSNFTADTGP